MNIKKFWPEPTTRARLDEISDRGKEYIDRFYKEKKESRRDIGDFIDIHHMIVRR